MKKKVFTIIIAIVMVIGMIPSGVFAASESVENPDAIQASTLVSDTEITQDTVVTLSSDLSLHGVEISNGATLTIYLNGYKLKLDSDTKRMFTVKGETHSNGGNLTIIGSEDEEKRKNEMIQGRSNANAMNGPFIQMDSNQYKAVVLANVTVDGFHTSYRGGAIELDYGYLYLKNTTIQNCSVDATGDDNIRGGGGAIIMWGRTSTIYMNNSTITNCKANGPGGWARGGGMFIFEGGQLYMKDSKITNCQATHGGGALHISGEESTMSIIDSEITGNSLPADSAQYGGGIICHSDVYSENIVIGGNTRITDNKRGNAVSNMHFENGSANGLTVQDPGANMLVGISLWSGSGTNNGTGRITKIDDGYGGYAKYFKADYSSYAVKFNSTGKYLEITNNNSSKSISNPNTGDKGTLILWIAVFVIMIAGIVICLICRKRRNQSR